MKQFKIIREANPKDFENKINKLASAGWKIKGNLKIDYECFLYVIMTKIEAK